MNTASTPSAAQPVLGVREADGDVGRASRRGDRSGSSSSEAARSRSCEVGDPRDRQRRVGLTWSSAWSRRSSEELRPGRGAASPTACSSTPGPRRGSSRTVLSSRSSAKTWSAQPGRRSTLPSGSVSGSDVAYSVGAFVVPSRAVTSSSLPNTPPVNRMMSAIASATRSFISSSVRTSGVPTPSTRAAHARHQDADVLLEPSRAQPLRRRGFAAAGVATSSPGGRLPSGGSPPARRRRPSPPRAQAAGPSARARRRRRLAERAAVAHVGRRGCAA
jgi:hypothetical protein